MHNEYIFLIQVLVIISVTMGCLRIGRDALITCITMQAFFANLFVLKQIDFLGFQSTCSDAFAIGSIFGLNLLQEYFGKAEAKKASWICFLFMLFSTVVTQIHLYYQPAQVDYAHSSYAQILSLTPRLLFASLSAFFLTQQMDVRLFEGLKKWLPSTSLTIRSQISLISSQFLDTSLFTLLGLYGEMAAIFDVMFISFVVKLLTIFSLTPIINLSKKIIRLPS